MDSIDNFDIKYWGNDFSYDFPRTKKRSTKRKLAIVVCFVGLLAVIPVLVFGLKNLQPQNGREISSAEILTPISKPSKVNPAAVITPTKAEVKKGDSYWRISKRACGSGKYYMSLRDLNEGKALYQGDSVAIACTL